MKKIITADFSKIERAALFSLMYGLGREKYKKFSKIRDMLTDEKFNVHQIWPVMRIDKGKAVYDRTVPDEYTLELIRPKRLIKQKKKYIGRVFEYKLKQKVLSESEEHTKHFKILDIRKMMHELAGKPLAVGIHVLELKNNFEVMKAIDAYNKSYKR